MNTNLSLGTILGSLLSALVTIGGGCIPLGGLLATSGCQSAGATSFNEKLVLIDKVQELAEKNGVSWSADIYSNGDPSLFARTDFGIDTKVQLVVHVQGNAQNANAEQDPTVVGPPALGVPETDSPDPQ